MKTRKLAALIMSLIITMSFVLSGCGNTEVVTSSNLSSTLDNSSSLDVSYSSILGEEETTSFVNSSEGSTSASKGSTTTSKQSGTNNNTNTNNGSSTSSYQAVVKPANLQETPPKFATGYITKEKTYIETKYVIFEIDANIYVVGDLAAKADEVCAAMEQVTGLSFNTNITGGKKVLVYVTREGIVGDEEYSTIIPNAVSGQVTSSRGDSCMSYMYLDPVCLFLGKSSAFLHEMSHVLRFAQSSVMFGTVLEEGFGSYVEYHTLQYLEKKGSATAYSLDSSLSVLRDIHFGEHLYKNTMDFWLAQTADYYRPNGNDNYAIGFRLLSYLKEKQGSAFSWIKQSNTLSDSDLIKSVYGKNVLNGFYNWVKQNDLKFFVDGSTYSPDTVDAANMVGLAPISIYPRFLQEYNETTLSYFSFNYKDLYINIEEARRYLSLYKNRNVDNLYLSLSDSSKVYLFDKNGKASALVTGGCVSLKGVSYIKLSGSGYMGALEIFGYYKPSDTFDKPVVIVEETLSTNGGSLALSNRYHEIMWRDDLEFHIVGTATLTDVAIAPMEWRVDPKRYNNKTEVVFSGPCRYIDVWNYGHKAVKVTVSVVKKK